jgi:hypothetical protein
MDRDSRGFPPVDNMPDFPANTARAILDAG